MNCRKKLLFVDLFDIFSVNIISMIILYKNLLPKYRIQAIPAVIGTTIKPTTVTYNVTIRCGCSNNNI